MQDLKYYLTEELHSNKTISIDKFINTVKENYQIVYGDIFDKSKLIDDLNDLWISGGRKPITLDDSVNFLNTIDAPTKTPISNSKDIDYYLEKKKRIDSKIIKVLFGVDKKFN